MSDLELIALWEQWKQSFAEELACETAQTTARTRMIEQRIAEAPAEGLVGIAIKLTLWRLTNSHNDAAAVQAEAAYCDVIGLVGRDFSAEAEVIAERLSPAMSQESQARLRAVSRRATGSGREWPAPQP